MKHVKSGDVVGFALAIGAPTAFYTPEMSAGADIVIAEVNDQMPKVYGDNWMPISAFDYFVEHSILIPEFKRKGEPSEVEFAIAENVASLIKDGIGKGKKSSMIVRKENVNAGKRLYCSSNRWRIRIRRGHSA